MAEIIENKSITFKEPMVLLPLEEWEKIEDALDEYECLVKYNEAVNDPDNQESISFDDVKKKLNLP